MASATSLPPPELSSRTKSRVPDATALSTWTKLAEDGRFGLPQVEADGAVLFHRGSDVTAAYFLTEGAVEVFQRSRDGQGLLVKVLRAPALFGVLEVVAHEEQWLESVRIYSHARLLRIPSTQFRQTLVDSPQASLECLRDTCAAFCSVARREPAAMAPVDVRLATVFLAYMHAASEPWDGGLQMLGKRTQSDLAQTIGASERSINGCLKAWKNAGTISKVDGKYIVHAPQTLVELAGELAYCLL